MDVLLIPVVGVVSRESRRAPPSQRRASPTRKRSRSPDGPTTPPPVGERPKRRLSEREGIEMMHPARRALAGGDDRRTYINILFTSRLSYMLMCGLSHQRWVLFLRPVSVVDLR